MRIGDVDIFIKQKRSGHLTVITERKPLYVRPGEAPRNKWKDQVEQN